MTNVVPIAEIKIKDDRQRRIFDEASIAELADSIAQMGLMHPLVLRDDHKTLVAGERRLRALNLLHAKGREFMCDGVLVRPGFAPYVAIAQLTPLQVEEAELEENIRRKDLTWQEYNYALAKLHKLRQAQAKLAGVPHRLVDTLNEVIGPRFDNNFGGEFAKLKNALVLADNLNDPEIVNAKDEKTAMKILEKRAAVKHRDVLAREFEQNKTDHVVVCGHANILLGSVEKGSVDVVLTDPPYGVEAGDFGSQADAAHDYEDSLEYALQCYSEVFRGAHVLCKPSAFIFAFCDIRVFPALERLAQTYLPGWSVWATPLIWDKGTGMLPVPDKGPRRAYEAIFYAYRGTRKWNATGVSDILSVPAVAKPTFGAQKPHELYTLLLSRVSLPGDVVLDPFAGSGPVIDAANALQCRAIAFELDKSKVDYIWAVRIGRAVELTEEEGQLL